MPQVVPLHVALPFATVAQGVHDAPQFATAVFDTQSAPQR